MPTFNSAQVHLSRLEERAACGAWPERLDHNLDFSRHLASMPSSQFCVRPISVTEHQPNFG